MPIAAFISHMFNQLYHSCKYKTGSICNEVWWTVFLIVFISSLICGGRNINVVFNNNEFYQWYANKLFCVNNKFYHFHCFLDFVFPITCLIPHFSLCILRCLMYFSPSVRYHLFETYHDFLLLRNAQILRTLGPKSST